MQGKRLFRSRNDRMIGGVAGGIAALLNIDPLLVRLGFLILGFLNGLGVLAYIALWLLIPSEGSTAEDARGQVRENVSEMQQAAEALMQRLRSMFSGS